MSPPVRDCIERGWLTLAPTRLGRRAFVGLGCATCHFLPDADPSGQPDFERVPLTGLGDRFPAGELAAFGLEPRHLRAFKTAADREVGLFEQVVTPLMRQRNPEAKARAEEAVRELAALSVRLHAALVKAGLRAELGG